jgi:argininosuccinate synthase
VKKIVTAYLGTGEDRAAIRRLSERTEVEVIAVALDVGGGHGLRELHDEARAAGAVRCHVFDASDEFARACLVPAIHVPDERSDDVVDAAAREFIARKLFEVANLEGAVDVQLAERTTLAGHGRRPSGSTPDRAARVDIRFEHGVPVSVNAIPMSVVEVMDSLATIAAAHALTGPRAALRVLQAAHAELSATGPATGSARVELYAGRIRAARKRDYART